MLIKPIEAKDCLKIRSLVLRDRLEPSLCKVPGDEDPTTFHLGAFKQSKLIGIASFLKEECNELEESNSYRLRGMASLQDYQGQGVGRKLIEAAIEQLKTKKTSLLWCNAREIAFPFYENLGFEYYSDFFDIEGIGPHKKMFRKIL